MFDIDFLLVKVHHVTLFIQAKKIRYRKVRAGNFYVKSRLPSTLAHRNLFIPMFEALASRNDVVMLMHDETTVNVNLSQPKAFVGDEEQAVDKRQESGKGLGKIRFLFLLFMRSKNRCWNQRFFGHLKSAHFAKPESKVGA